MSLTTVSANAEGLRRELTFEFIQTASKSLGDIFRPSFGPKGTYKMYSIAILIILGWCLEPGKFALPRMVASCSVIWYNLS